MITLIFDVRHKTEVNNAVNSLSDKWKTIDILVNNAGNAHGHSPIDKGDVNDWDAMIYGDIKVFYTFKKRLYHKW